MEKKESRKVPGIKDPTFENKKLKASTNSNNKKDKSLPWWVELLFVQIGLPDKWLIKVLKSKKKYTEMLKNEKKLIIIFLFFLAGLTYIYPLIKFADIVIPRGGENTVAVNLVTQQVVKQLDKVSIKLKTG